MGDQEEPACNASSFLHCTQTSTVEWKYQGGKRESCINKCEIRWFIQILEIFLYVKEISGTTLFAS